MKTYYLAAILVTLYALFGAVSCTNPALKVNTPAVQAQVIGDAEKVLLAGGGALLISGGNTGAAVQAMTAQEIQNIPQLQKVLATAAKQPVEPVTP